MGKLWEVAKLFWNSDMAAAYAQLASAGDCAPGAPCPEKSVLIPLIFRPLKAGRLPATFSMTSLSHATRNA